MKESKLHKLNQERESIQNEIHRMQIELEIEDYHKNARGRGFGKIEAGDIVIFNKQILYDFLEKRIYETKVKIEDLFLLCKAPNGLEGEQIVKTKFGDLRVFFVNKPLTRSWLLHKSKYDYPKISKVSTKGSHKSLDEIVREHSPFKVDQTTRVKEALKETKSK